MRKTKKILKIIMLVLILIIILCGISFGIVMYFDKIEQKKQYEIERKE